MTNVEALKELYVSLGGDEDTVADVDTNAEMIHEIATIAAAVVGATLPAVTASDNGKVLKVVDGEWGVGTDATA